MDLTLTWDLILTVLSLLTSLTISGIAFVFSAIGLFLIYRIYSHLKARKLFDTSVPTDWVIGQQNRMIPLITEKGNSIIDVN